MDDSANSDYSLDDDIKTDYNPNIQDDFLGGLYYKDILQEEEEEDQSSSSLDKDIQQLYARNKEEMKQIADLADMNLTIPPQKATTSKNTISTELVEGESVEDEMMEDELAEDELPEDELGEDELAEDELPEDELAEDDSVGDELVEGILARKRIELEANLNCDYEYKTPPAKLPQNCSKINYSNKQSEVPFEVKKSVTRNLEAAFNDFKEPEKAVSSRYFQKLEPKASYCEASTNTYEEEPCSSQSLDLPVRNPTVDSTTQADLDLEEEIVCTCIISNPQLDEDMDSRDDFYQDFESTLERELQQQFTSPVDESKLWRKRKIDDGQFNGEPKKRVLNDSIAGGHHTSPLDMERSPVLSNSISFEFPELNQWLTKFNSWTNSERLKAIDALINGCASDQVRHMMEAIEPLFQRDFISLLPKELALSVLGYLSAFDLLRAAQTCRYWRYLADDNLLWKEQCRQIGIQLVRRRSRTMPNLSAWKATYMRHHIIENNWYKKTIRMPKYLKGHDDHVITCLQFYGNKILSGSDDTTLKLWSAVSGKCLRTLSGHTGGVWSSQMIGRVIVSGSTDRTLRVWDARTGECLKVLIGHISTVRCMHLHNDRVVSGSRDATLRVWSVTHGKCLKVLVGHLAAVRCVQYDGRFVVSGAYDYFVKVWNPDTGECLHTLTGHTNRVYSLQFDGVHIVSGSLDTSIRVWDVETGHLKHTLMGHQSLTSGMELRSNILVSGNADSTVKIWDIRNGRCLHTLSGPNKHQSAVTCVQSTKRFVITSSDDGTVKLWDLRTGEFIRNLTTLASGGSGGVVWRIRASPTKLVCAVGSRNGTEETKLLVLDFDVPGSCLKCNE